MFYTFVLQSEGEGEFYMGLTANLKLTFEQHNKGLVESTKRRWPFCGYNGIQEPRFRRN
jgi:putative endonuclease